METSELNRLLALVEFRPVGNYVEGLDAFRDLLEQDEAGLVLKFLTRALRKLEGRKRSGIAFIVAEHFAKDGDLKNLQRLFGTDDSGVKQSVLSALWGDPRAFPKLGPGIVALALAATQHPAPEVRAGACSVLQNQCAWGMDVSGALAPLQSLLEDSSPRVRRYAAAAVGNLAKDGHDLSGHVARLRQNVKHPDMYVRESSAWALWQLSRAKHDIGSAVPELVWLLNDPEEYDEQRKKAAGALLHHARKSAANRQQVKEAVRAARLGGSPRRHVRSFLDQLGERK